MKKKEKEEVLNQLKTTPIVQVACQKVGVSRATFYRWKAEDAEFSAKVDASLREGKGYVCDMAESQIIKMIKDGDRTASMYWLNNHHPDYTYRRVALPPEQTKLIMDNIRSSKKHDATIALIQKMIDGDVPIPLVRHLIPIIEKLKKDSATRQSDDLIDILARIIDGNSRGKTMSKEEEEKLRLDFHEVCGTVDTDESSKSTT